MKNNTDNSPSKEAGATGVPHKRGSTILGRLARALRDQSWPTVALELVIVVLGVVIGFQVTAWGNEREARAEEQKLLSGLQAEFNQVVVDLQSQLGVHQRVERAISTTLEELSQAYDAGLPYASIPDTTLAWAYVPSTTQFSQGILKGMLTAGQLGLIHDQELRTALAEWEGILAEVTEDEVMARNIVVYHIEPILWSRMNVQAIRSYRLTRHTGNTPERKASSDVPADFETIGVFATRLHWQKHIVGSFSNPRKAAGEILTLIDRSLK